MIDRNDLNLGQDHVTLLDGWDEDEKEQEQDGLPWDDR